MNTMVGLEASLHTSVSDGISDLMKNNYNKGDNNEPIQLNGAGGANGARMLSDDGMMDDDDDGVADIFDDDFDPDILLRSPLFNDSSAGRMIEFDTDQASSMVGSSVTSNSSHHGDAIGSTSGYSSPGQHTQQLRSPSNASSAQEEMDLYDVSKVAASGNVGGYQQNRSSFLGSPPKRTFSSPGNLVAPYQVIKQHEAGGSRLMSAPGGGSTDLAHMSHVAMSSQMAFTNNSESGVMMDGISVSNGGGQARMDVSSPSRRQRGFPSSPASRSLPARAASLQAPRRMSSISLQQQQMQQQMQNPQTSSMQPMQMTSQPGVVAQQPVSILRQPQHHQQQPAPMRPLPQMRPLGLSQTVHGQYTSAAPSHGHDPLIGSLSGSSLHGGVESGSVVSHGDQNHHMHYGGRQADNVSVAAVPQDRDNDNNQYNPFAGMPGGGMSNGNPHQSPIPLNEAMEKLCESMKRSAMSRNLVKQYSGRTLVRQNSGRNVVRQNSFRGGVARSGSFRGVVRQNSGGRMVVAVAARSLLDDNSSGKGQPIRMPPTKHQLEHHGRGVYRHNSAQNLNGGSNHGINLQIDGRNMGAL